MTRYLILAGSNSGDRLHYLKQAAISLQQLSENNLISSGIYESKAWGFNSTNYFLNQAHLIFFSSDPQKLLSILLKIEKSFCRTRNLERTYQDRTLDLDILLAENLIICEENLTIPHPLMQFRKFALKPSAEIAPMWIHPVLGKSIEELLLTCPDHIPVHLLDFK